MRTLALALVLLCGLTPWTSDDDRVRIDAIVAPGRTVVSFDVESEWRLDTFTLRFDDAELGAPGWDLAQGLDRTARERVRLRWSDSVEATDGARSLVGQCRFVELELERDASGSFIAPERVDRTRPLLARSPLVGRDANYAWDSERASHACTVVPDPTSPAAADALRPTVVDELAELAPGRAVGRGSAWHVDANVLGALLEPGAAFEFEDELGGVVRPWSTRGDVEAQDADLRVELRDVLETEAGRFAELALRGRVEWERDRTPDLADERPKLAFYPARPDSVVETVGVAATGRVHWDLARGVPAEVDIEFELHRTQRIVVPTGSGSRMVLDLAWSGTQRVSGRFRPASDSER
ncbi:MAG: hypothetical protein IT453_13875 [Planctomycetes bacterium]|nr:hypothetical protein [Planctomycetota bacterium]